MDIIYVVSSEGHFGRERERERERVFSEVVGTFCW